MDLEDVEGAWRNIALELAYLQNNIETSQVPGE